ncbi:MAG: hypothetical protein LBQ64_00755 [Bacteroidales bacterium]|jgi:hypothetical protein|nr:hypothetical protein [Bacteroidales bacterium]
MSYILNMTICKNKTKGFFYTLTVLLFVSCGNKQETIQNEQFFLTEETLPHKVTLGFSTNDSIRALSDDIVMQLLQNLKNYEGVNPNIQTILPDNWGVEYKLTAMSPDFDIWIIANMGSPVYKMLATITTSETPVVIQAIPIAYTTAIEKVNYMESEQWEALIKEDYKIIVTKTYEKLYSLTDTAPNKESIYVQKEDVYYIENNGKITYEIPPSFHVDYRAIILFADTAAIGNVLDEEWLWNCVSIQEKAEQEGILFAAATTHFDKLSLFDYHGEEIDIIDISTYLNKHSRGYLVVKKGIQPLFIPYVSAEECLQKAFPYFGLTYEPRQNQEEDLSINP